MAVWPVLLAAALVVAVVVAVVPGPAGDDPGAGPDAAGAFLADYQRSRLATFVVEQRFTRTLADGRSLDEATRIVQRPPDDRLVLGLGSVSGRRDGRVVACTTDPGADPATAAPRCTTGPPAEPYDAEVAAEVDALRAYLAGDRPLYEVTATDAGCYELALARPDFPSPPYGTAATFCFDPATGAPRLVEIRRDGSADRTEATAIRTVVRPSDLVLPG
jgi:hypothetical protein